MSRKGCPNKIQSGITYPRKCETCDYVSNNPSMYSYHKKTHSSLDGKFCRCGNSATHVGTMGKYRCNENPHLCPKYLEEHSKRVKEHWERPEADQRKKDTAASTIERLCTPEMRKKGSITKRTKTGLLTEEKRKIFRRYAYSCRKLAQLWAKENGYEIGRDTFHVDHIYSVLDGFTNEVEPAIISHPANLRILAAKDNSSKGRKSLITLEELLRNISNG